MTVRQSSDFGGRPRLLPSMWRCSLHGEPAFRANFSRYSPSYVLFSGFSLLLTLLVY